MQTQPTQQALFNRALLHLEEGKSEEARAVLDAIQIDTDAQQHDLTYLMGWYYVISKQWENATQKLAPLGTYTHGEDEGTRQETQLERERLVIYFLRLGQTAFGLTHYEDATRHFILCLKILHDRRIHLPALRIEVRYNLAMTYIMKGLYTVAIQQYEDALRLCHHYEYKEALPTIYYGLSEAYRCMGNFTKAHETGNEALRLYQERGDEPLQGRMHNMLGRIASSLGDYEAAVSYYQTSRALAISNNQPQMILLNYVALAKVYLEQGCIDEAKEYVQRASQIMSQVEDPFLCGIVCTALGKVALAEVRLASTTRRQHAYDEAISWLQKAVVHLIAAQAFKALAEAYIYLATASEEMGQWQDAVSYWKLAFAETDKAKRIRYGCE